ncbi:MAG TPA: hypothetical protein VF458_11505 [Ktedonobacteraceae bacterium]
MMLLLDKPETGMFVPRHIIFERRDADAYQVDDALAAVPFLEGEVRTELEKAREVVSPGHEGVQAMSEELQPEAPVPAIEPEVRPLSVEPRQVQFRQALLEVDDPDDFWAGVVGGQVTATEELWPLTGSHVFELFEDAIHDLEFSETWLAGYLLGLGDALLRHRKIYPTTYAARLKPLTDRPTRRKRH